MSKYNNQIYESYVEEVKKNSELSNKLKYLKLDYDVLKQVLKQIEKTFDSKIESKVEKITSPFIIENNNLKQELSDAYNEIERLKKSNSSTTNW